MTEAAPITRPTTAARVVVTEERLDLEVAALGRDLGGAVPARLGFASVDCDSAMHAVLLAALHVTFSVLFGRCVLGVVCVFAV